MHLRTNLPLLPDLAIRQLKLTIVIRSLPKLFLRKTCNSGVILVKFGREPGVDESALI